MLKRLQTLVAVVLIAGMVSGWAAPSAAVGAESQRQTPRVAHVADATVSAEPPARDERSGTIIVLLVGLGAAAGVVIGVMPALVAAVALGYLPPPRRWSPRSGALGDPAPGALAEASTPGSVPGDPPAPAAPAHDGSAHDDAPRHGAPAHGDAPLRSRQLTVLAHARHQDVYDTAYAEQLERVGALRSAIGDRRRTAPASPSEPQPTPPAKGTS